jgi:hypothetical protein
MKLWVGPEEMVVELALNAEQQRTGMMFRTNLAENAGMFFPRAQPNILIHSLKAKSCLEFEPADNPQPLVVHQQYPVPSCYAQWGS